MVSIVVAIPTITMGSKFMALAIPVGVEAMSPEGGTGAPV